MSSLNSFITVLLCLFVQITFAQLSVNTNHANARYEIGENIQFEINSSNSGIANYIIQYDKFANPIQTGSINVTAGVPATISYSHNEASHIQCIVSLADQSVTSSATVGCANMAPKKTVVTLSTNPSHDTLVCVRHLTSNQSLPDEASHRDGDVPRGQHAT